MLSWRGLLVGMLFFPSLWRRLRSGDRWPLSNSPSDLNSLSSFASSLLGPGSDGPGKNIPFSSNVLFILKLRNNRNHTRRSNRRRAKKIYHDKINERFIKNLSNYEMTTDQINLLSKGLKFIPTPSVKENAVRQRLLLDFKHFARRMRLRYIFHNKEKEQHPFHVKSGWEPPVQPSVALETYLEEVKVQLAEIKLIKQRKNLPFKERKAIKDLRSNSEIVIKKADRNNNGHNEHKRQNTGGPSSTRRQS